MGVFSLSFLTSLNILPGEGTVRTGEERGGSVREGRGEGFFSQKRRRLARRRGYAYFRHSGRDWTSGRAERRGVVAVGRTESSWRQRDVLSDTRWLWRMTTEGRYALKVAYVVGPYRADTINGVAQNIQKSRDVALRLWKLGYAAICPHSNTAFFDGACPDSVWLEGDIEILKRCDLVVLVDGWENSAGARREVEVAAAHGIPIYDEQWVSNIEGLFAKQGDELPTTPCNKG